MQRTSIAWLAACSFGLILLSAAAQAQTGTTVLELYTSQGCSSCPPADRLLHSYAKRRDVVALSFNVDYWDYLGWKDTLGNSVFSKRQRTYAMKRGDGEVYTPQVVVNGVTHAVGSMRGRIDRAIARSKRAIGNRRVPLDVRMKGGQLIVDVGDDESWKRTKSATIWLATVRRKVSVAVRRGENRGNTLTYHNVVRKLTHQSACGRAIGPLSG